MQFVSFISGVLATGYTCTYIYLIEYHTDVLLKSLPNLIIRILLSRRAHFTTGCRCPVGVRCAVINLHRIVVTVGFVESQQSRSVFHWTKKTNLLHTPSVDGALSHIRVTRRHDALHHIQHCVNLNIRVCVYHIV